LHEKLKRNVGFYKEIGAAAAVIDVLTDTGKRIAAPVWIKNSSMLKHLLESRAATLASRAVVGKKWR
jgi:hypothetical protein